MNKPAPKEPSMDEILSSIRQIIADDDAAVVPMSPAPASAPAKAAQPLPPAARPFAGLSTPSPAAPPPTAAAPAPAMAATSGSATSEPRPIMPAPVSARPEPLALSPEQILSSEEEEPVTALGFADILGEGGLAGEGTSAVEEAHLVDPEDIAFELDDEPEPQEPAPAPAVAEKAAVVPRPIVAAETPTSRLVSPQFAPRQSPGIAQVAPMPDPTLSADLAEQLLEPATTSAVKHAFSRLSGLSMVNTGVTIEDMMREMLRPMLKEWLDENLPAIVERMVEKEIARISRGVE